MITRSSPSQEYKFKLSLLLSSLSSIDLSGEIFDQSDHIYGRGGFGDVFTAKSRRHGGLMVAVKRLRVHILPEESDAAKMMLRELKIWSTVDHPNVLPLLGFTMHDSYPALVSPWMTKGSVRKYMDSGGSTSMPYLAKDIALGLKYLHDNDIIHSDLKCDNILLSGSDVPMLADFGISRCISSVSISNSTSMKGSARWMAKEFFQVSIDGPDAIVVHSKETDVWAFGMVLYELLSGVIPFNHLKTDIRVSFAVAAGQTPSRPPCSIDEEVHNLLWELAKKCWRENASERPGLSSICDALRNFGSGEKNTSNIAFNHTVEAPGSDESVNPERKMMLTEHRVKVSINKLLRLGSESLVVYDFRLPPDFARHYGPGISTQRRYAPLYLTTGEYQQWACTPPQSVLFVATKFIFPSYTASPCESELKVLPATQGSYVTVYDVLKTLYDAFNSPVSPEAKISLRKEHLLQAEFSAAFAMRCEVRARKLHTKGEDEAEKGMMCVDWFGKGRSFFGGLVQLESKEAAMGGAAEVWKLCACRFVDPNAHLWDF